MARSKSGSRTRGQQHSSAPSKQKSGSEIVVTTATKEPKEVVKHEPPPKHSSPFEQMKHLAPFMGRDGLVIVGGAFPAHAAVMAGVNPAYAYGSAIILAVLYMIQTWRHP